MLIFLCGLPLVSLSHRMKIIINEEACYENNFLGFNLILYISVNGM